MKRNSISLAAAGLAIGFSLSAAIDLISPAPFATVQAAEGDKAPVPSPPDDGKLRIICFGAHPDDCELCAAGTAALWAAQGHHVKFVSVTNRDIGHWRGAGGPLAQRRNSEVARADALLHVTSEVLDIHDGELLPTIENRRTITRLIRQWNAEFAEAFEICEYGRQPTKDELRQLFPFTTRNP